MSNETVSSPKSAPLPKTLHQSLLDDTDDSSQLLDTDLKPAQRMTWFLFVWNFIYSYSSTLKQDIKDMFILIWTWILLRFPFLSKALSISSSATSTSTSTKKISRTLKKPIQINKNMKNVRLPSSKEIRRK